jgi:hypothetical protein
VYFDARAPEPSRRTMKHVPLSVPGAKPISRPAQKSAGICRSHCANPLATSTKTIRQKMPDDRTGICLVGHNI